MLQLIGKAGAADGTLLSLCGIMMAEGINDADGYVPVVVRRQVGPRVPVVVQLDSDVNVSRQMVAMADVLIGRKLFPMDH